MTGPRALSIARTAERFGQRPSHLVGLVEPLRALALDEALALRLALAEQSAMTAQRSRAQPKGTIAPGLVYESADDVRRAEIAARARVH